MVPCLHQGNTDMKRKLRVKRDLKCIPLVGAKNSPVRAVKIPRLKGVGIVPRTETCVKWGGHTAMVPCLHQGNVSFKRKLRVWRDQKCIPLVGAKIPLTCASRQIAPSQMRRYRAMVPCLHQGNIYIKRKPRVWRDQKYTPLVGAKSSPVRAVKLPRLKGVGIGPRTETCGNWGGHTAMVPCLHQGNVSFKRKLRVWRDQKCIPLVGAKIPLTCASRQIAPSQMRWYRVDK